jgi:2,3-bisphosphoglycerate-independent phosphoglycerate mutase
MSDKPVVLIVLDGWGINRNTEGNAIASAQAPVYHSLTKECPNTELRASGERSVARRPDGTSKWAT